MNAPLARTVIPPKHRFTVSTFHRLWEEGFFPGYPALELLEGEIYEMPEDGARTISWNTAIAEWLYGILAGKPYRIVPDKTLRVSDTSAPKPDFWIYPRDLSVSEVTAARCLLAIEVADTSLPYDRDIKAPIYAAGGLRDYWIIDVVAREILVHRLGPDGRYGQPTVVKAEAAASALLIPEVSLRLADLDIPPV